MLTGRHTRNLVHILPVDENPSGRRCLKAGQHPQQRRFARARATQQAEDLAPLHVQRNVFTATKSPKRLLTFSIRRYGAEPARRLLLTYDRRRTLVLRSLAGLKRVHVRVNSR